MNTAQRIGFFGGPLVFAAILLYPVMFALPEGMTPEMISLLAVISLMAIWWVTEAIPIPATALLPIALFPLLGIMKSAESTTPYANHLIYLFIGGFFLAVAMEKWNLHKRIALHTIRIIGTGPTRVILGFMIATAFLSMWVSNTATAMMMMPVGMAVITQVVSVLKDEGVEVNPNKFNFGTALMLGIAYAASIGGVGTIIGTPPNTVLVGVIESQYGQTISFA
ncbi:MAG: anion permease, partial [Anaerolineae bacterium]|nr:anion permease [Anaerolineae bacterium]